MTTQDYTRSVNFLYQDSSIVGLSSEFLSDQQANSGGRKLVDYVTGVQGCGFPDNLSLPSLQ